MGGLGEARLVNLDKYLAALEIFSGSGSSQGLKRALASNGIEGNVTVYTGPENGDGEVVIPYEVKLSGGKKLNGLLKFDRFGSISGGLKDNNVSGDVATYFIGGLFGASEVTSVADEAESVFHRALISGCNVMSKNSGCNETALRAAKVKGDEVRRQAAEARQVADVKAKGDATATKEAAFSKEIEGMSALITDMIAWATKEDAGPGGIDPDDITDVMTKYSTQLALADSKEKKAGLLKDAIKGIITTDTGKEYGEIRGFRKCETSYKATEQPCQEDCPTSSRKFPFGKASGHIQETIISCINEFPNVEPFTDIKRKYPCEISGSSCN